MVSGRHLARATFGACLFAAVVLGAACAPNAPQDTLAPDVGPIAQQINRLWWTVFWMAAGVFVIVEGLLLFALFRFRERRRTPAPTQIHGHTRLEVAWTIAPALLLTVVAVLTVRGIFALARTPTGDVLNVTVTAHQWWWEYEYPDQQVVAANELHIPVGKSVFLTLRSDDVIHSFWVPKLAGKQDVIPGRDNNLTIRASMPGTYRGQCAEYCGISHANMRLLVVAQSAQDFDAWVEAQKQPAVSPTEALAAQGERLFMEGECVNCHAVQGTVAGATLAPDLTHFASRTTFAGALFENNPENVARWLQDPPAMKPMPVSFPPDPRGQNIGMPDYNLSEGEIAALVAYLGTLK